MPYSIPASSKQKADAVDGSKRVRMMNTIGFMDGYLSSPEKNSLLLIIILGGCSCGWNEV
jgi:hypothetical protein